MLHCVKGPKYFSCFLCKWSLLCLVALSKSVSANVVDITGGVLKELSGLKSDAIILARYEKNRFIQVPFQVDDYNVDGRLFFDEGGVAMAGQRGIIDQTDHLLFLSTDAGSERFVKSEEEVTPLYEVKLKWAQQTYFIYVLPVDTTLPLSRMESDKKYVSYDKESGLIETDYYSLESNPHNFLDWADFQYFNYTGPKTQSLIDTFKLRVSGSVLGDLASLTLSNKNLKAIQIGLINGPIRASALFKTRVQVAKIPVMSLQLQASYYPKKIEAQAGAKPPSIIAPFFEHASLRATLDGNDLRGAKIYTALGKEFSADVDGKLTRNEMILNEQRIDVEHQNWLLLDHPEHFGFLLQIHVDEKYNTPVSLVYEDDPLMNDKPERYRGQLPNIGYFVERIPKNRMYVLSLSLYLNDGLKGQDVNEFVDAQLQKPELDILPLATLKHETFDLTPSN